MKNCSLDMIIIDQLFLYSGRAHTDGANSWGLGFESCLLHDFFLLFSILSEVHPWFRSLTEVQHYWFSCKNIMLSCAAWGEKTVLCKKNFFYAGSITCCNWSKANCDGGRGGRKRSYLLIRGIPLREPVLDCTEHNTAKFPIVLCCDLCPCNAF